MLWRILRIIAGTATGILLYFPLLFILGSIVDVLTNQRDWSSTGATSVLVVAFSASAFGILIAGPPIVIVNLLAERFVQSSIQRSVWFSIASWVIFAVVSMLVSNVVNRPNASGTSMALWSAAISGLAYWCVAVRKWPSLSNRSASYEFQRFTSVPAVVLAIQSIFLGGLYTIPNFPFGPYTLYTNTPAEQLSRSIPFERLSNQTSHPFLYGAAGPQFDAAIKKWPDVRDCLVRSEQTKEEPDLRLIDWNLFWDSEDAKVCLWRIFSSLGNPERSAAWLRFQGFKVEPIREGRKHLSKAYKLLPKELLGGQGRRRIKSYSVVGARSLRKQNALFPTRGISRLMTNSIAHAESVHCVWTFNNYLLMVGTVKNVL